MYDMYLKLIIIFGIFVTISIIMDFKAKNFISENHNMIWYALMFSCAHIVAFNNYDNPYYKFITPVVLSSFVACVIIFHKNKRYLFREIDKKLIDENRDGIIEIINNYKNNYLDDKSEITLLKNRVVFEGMSNAQVEEGLILIGDFLNKNRKKYTVADYVKYIVKSWILPYVISIAVAFIAIKLIMNSL
ncbi:hypothetical protein [Sedimentibacter sp.]|uniref:hypothetical protein n=1 Tax=Sedimentibacter sp. TaxID=1960295 RepID=UPI0028AF54F7|nr:hypothetical protein [Sedimentibacter sp.]